LFYALLILIHSRTLKNKLEFDILVLCLRGLGAKQLAWSWALSSSQQVGCRSGISKDILFSSNK
jgi:hypothetical protein